MKVAVNGGLNCSILDGWWVEGYDGDNGFAIGAGEEYADLNYQDEVEGRLLYELIERDLVPLFYNRDAEALPRQWIRRMKRSISTLVPVYNTNRMVEEYYKTCYLPSHHRFKTLSANHLAAAAELADWRKDLLAAWGNIKVEGITAPTSDLMKVGGEFPVSVTVNLGSLTPKDVEVQICYGLLDSLGELTAPKSKALTATGANGATETFTGNVHCERSGQFGFSVRVLPKHANLPTPFEPAVITWG